MTYNAMESCSTGELALLNVSNVCLQIYEDVQQHIKCSQFNFYSRS